MEPKNNRFGGGASVTLLHPVVALGMLIAIVLILTLPRKKAIVPFLLAVLTIPMGQVVLVGAVHFTMMRILILAGLVRAAYSQASSSERWFTTRFSRIDQVVVLWLVSAFIVVNLQWMNAPMLIASLGNLVDTLGGYLVLRFLIPDGETVRRTIRALAAICVIHGICMISEQVTRFNVFDWIGGMNLPVEGIVRDGVLRSTGVMGPLGAGVFAGVLIPLFVWLSTEKESRMAAYAGLAGATAMLITTHASTPWLGCAAGLLGLGFWPLRHRVRIIRWGFGLSLLALHLVMKAPVWHLISRVDLTGSSSSWHRYTLVNQTILHFSDWWLLGYRYYDKWDWDMWDTSNLFVAAALSGGLITLVWLIFTFSRSFGAIGRARKRVRGDRKQEWFLWCWGSTLFAVLASCFGIAFLYQSQIFLLALFACICVITFEARRAVLRTAAALADVEVAFASGNAESDLLSDEGGQETGQASMRA